MMAGSIPYRCARAKTRLRARSAASVVLIVVAAGCTGGSDHSQPSPGLPGEAPFAATLTQSRTDLGTPMVNAQLTNTSDTPVTVASIEVRSPALAAVPASEKDTTYEPGRIIDLRTPYGRPLCKTDKLTSATFELVLDDGTTLSLPVDKHGLGWLNGLYRHDCAVRALERVAKVAFAPDAQRTTRGTDQYLEASLTVRRPADSPTSTPFEVHELGGSVLLRMLPRTAGEFPFVLAPGQRQATIPILIGTFRCGPHEMSASQQTFVLSAYASTPDLHVQRLILTPPPVVREKAQQLLVDVCVG
jgi:hypothetical protein